MFGNTRTGHATPVMTSADHFGCFHSVLGRAIPIPTARTYAAPTARVKIVFAVIPVIPCTTNGLTPRLTSVCGVGFEYQDVCSSQGGACLHTRDKTRSSASTHASRAFDRALPPCPVIGKDKVKHPLAGAHKESRRAHQKSQWREQVERSFLNNVHRRPLCAGHHYAGTDTVKELIELRVASGGLPICGERRRGALRRAGSLPINRSTAVDFAFACQIVSLAGACCQPLCSAFYNSRHRLDAATPPRLPVGSNPCSGSTTTRNC